MDGPVRPAGAGGGRTPLAPAPDGRWRVGRARAQSEPSSRSRAAVCGCWSTSTSVLTTRTASNGTASRRFTARKGLRRALPGTDLARRGGDPPDPGGGRGGGGPLWGRVGADGHGAGLLPLESDEGLGPEEAVRRVRAETGLRGDSGPAGGDTERGPGSLGPLKGSGYGKTLLVEPGSLRLARGEAS